MVNTKINLCGVTLDNPVIPASGTFGFGYEFADIYDINVLGSLSFKGTTVEPRYGNPTPRIAETASGMLNSVGLQNPGIDKVISEELPKLRACFHKPIMANISGFSLDDYTEACRKIDAEEQVAFISADDRASPRQGQTDKEHIIPATVGVIPPPLGVDAEIVEMIGHLAHRLLGLVEMDMLRDILEFGVTVFHNSLHSAAQRRHKYPLKFDRVGDLCRRHVSPTRVTDTYGPRPYVGRIWA